ncbi:MULTISPECIES: 3-deoxy-manno-octulosonate-8-phosphatase KdsC [Gammaproteobacteria]|uniref:3-deoxy-manno-octulosonate-8-phosphatase KdsC n=1 Tax=Gammaproteobacteria TaxID=1236 RepID=UPI000DD0A0C0|nr:MULTISPECIES: 3-deoxy-manno-octulosonate-8-phosphatase KdsC [Gammaproteobacteria]RTE86349.1 3-deoxy-manno-octulosonate-8-phosphatase KdsC [Aliidiomarina sp. B3213]TCZ91699.1 3-deoxy-manno-octulosonate-8-phosphatase KdsC [Lysobacter sp. N42]
MISTWYGEITEELFDRLQKIKLLVCDIDGVFSDGRIYMGNDGEELKAFHTRDGLGVKALRSAGVEVAVITGRKSKIVETRMTALGVPYIFQGQENKQASYDSVCKTLNLTPEQTGYIGDDTPDLELIKSCGLGVAVFDAHPSVQLAADYVTIQRGGFGAVREIADLILLAQGKLSQVVESST